MRPDRDKPYYTAYEKRYRSTYDQGADFYLFLPAEKEINRLIQEYIRNWGLSGKKIVEFGCGQGRAGLEFARCGCMYCGYDIAPSAVEKAKEILSGYPNDEVYLHDLVLTELPENRFDAGIDIAALHMIIVDDDRKKYLGNVYKSLKPGAPMYFVHEGKNDIYSGTISSYEQWLELTGEDVDTPEEREAVKNEKAFRVMLPRIAARPRSTEGYRKELTQAGFEILKLETNINWDNVTTLARKPAR